MIRRLEAQKNTAESELSSLKATGYQGIPASEAEKERQRELVEEVERLKKGIMDEESQHNTAWKRQESEIQRLNTLNRDAEHRKNDAMMMRATFQKTIRKHRKDLKEQSKNTKPETQR